MRVLFATPGRRAGCVLALTIVALCVACWRVPVWFLEPADDWNRQLRTASLWQALGDGVPIGRRHYPVAVQWTVVIQRGVCVLAFAGGLMAVTTARAGQWRSRVAVALAVLLLGVGLWVTSVWVPTYRVVDFSGIPGQSAPQHENVQLSDVAFADVSWIRASYGVGTQDVTYSTRLPDGRLHRVRWLGGSRVHWPLLFGEQSLILLFGGALIGWLLRRERRGQVVDPDGDVVAG